MIMENSSLNMILSPLEEQNMCPEKRKAFLKNAISQNLDYYSPRRKLTDIRRKIKSPIYFKVKKFI